MCNDQNTVQIDEQISEFLNNNEDKILSYLSDLVKCKSITTTLDKNNDDEPFGSEVTKALRYVLSCANADGFYTKSNKNITGYIDFFNEDTINENSSKKLLGVPLHLDVVPASNEGWISPAFAGSINETDQTKVLIGRGSIDNKASVAAVYFAIKFLKSISFKPKNIVRLIFGLDEETNWESIEYYKNTERHPDFCLVPDADFPLVYAEKGILHFEIIRKLSKNVDKGAVITSIKGGNALNAVPDKCEVVLKEITKPMLSGLVDTFNKNNDDLPNLSLLGVGKSFKVVSFGKASHASAPHLGVNAISIMMKFLSGVKLASDDLYSFIEFYNEKIGFDNSGEGLNVKLSDEASGNLTLSVNLINCDKEKISINLDMRHPVSINYIYIYDRISKILDEQNDIGLIKIDYKAPINMSTEDEKVKALLDTYYEEVNKNDTDFLNEYSVSENRIIKDGIEEKINKVRNAEPLAIGGGTFARAFNNAVSFGPDFKTDEPLAHQTNERITIDKLKKIIKIYAKAIIRLDDML